MENISIEFEGGGFLTLTKNDEGFEILFQAPYMEEQFRITSMSAQITQEEAAELAKWILGGTSINE